MTLEYVILYIERYIEEQAGILECNTIQSEIYKMHPDDRLILEEDIKQMSDGLKELKKRLSKVPSNG